MKMNILRLIIVFVIAYLTTSLFFYCREKYLINEIEKQKDIKTIVDLPVNGMFASEYIKK